MFIDINKPLFLQADAARMTNAESKDLNNWISRGLIKFPTSSPTTSGRRYYRMTDIFKVATMVEMSSLTPPAISSKVGEKVASIADALQAESIESTIDILEHRVGTSPMNIIVNFDENSTLNALYFERSYPDFNLDEPYIVVPATHILLKVWKRLDTLIKFENLKTPKVYFEI